jgi:hypothetical protein
MYSPAGRLRFGRPMGFEPITGRGRTRGRLGVESGPDSSIERKEMEVRMPIALSRRSLIVAAVAAGVAALLAAILASQLGSPAQAEAADHRDAPGLMPPGGDNRADISDIYAFQAPANPRRTVLVVNVNGLTPAGTPAYFGRGVPGVAANKRIHYYVYVDRDGDAVEDITYRFTFGKPRRGVQPFELRRNGRVVIPMHEGRTTRFGATPRIVTEGGTRVFAGVREDPFFFDLNGFLNLTAPLDADPANDALSFIGCDPAAGRPDFFAGTNVSSIVLEVPDSALGSGTVGVWSATTIGGEQVDRMGRPAIATVFIPNNPIPPDNTGDSQKSAFNKAHPMDDQANFRGEVVNTLTTLFSLNDTGGPVGGMDNPSDDAAAIEGLADILLPDLLTIDLGSGDGFLNGRKLADDVIDAELGLISEGLVTTDCVPQNDATFSNSFPYLAAPFA